MSNRRLIVNIQRRGGVDNDARIESHARLIASKMMSTRMLNTIRLTIKLRAGLPKDRWGQCHFRDLSKGTTARSKHYTIIIQRDAPLRQQLSTLTHEIRHAEQMATGRLTVRRTYGVWGYFWRAPGQRGPATKYPVIDAECTTPWRERPWEIEAIQAERDYAEYARGATK